MTESNCSICLEPLSSNKIGAANCGHCFHVDCMSEWERTSLEKNARRSGNTEFRSKCPNCNVYIERFIDIFISFNNEDIGNISESDSEKGGNQDDMSKQKICTEENIRMKSKLVSLKVKCSSLQLSLDEQKKRSDEYITYKSKVDSVENENESLKGKLEQTIYEVKKSERWMKKSETNLQQSKDRNEALTIEIGWIKSELARSKHEIEAVSKRVDVTDMSTVQEMHKKYQSMFRKIEDLKNEIKERDKIINRIQVKSHQNSRSDIKGNNGNIRKKISLKKMREDFEEVQLQRKRQEDNKNNSMMMSKMTSTTRDIARAAKKRARGPACSVGISITSTISDRALSIGVMPKKYTSSKQTGAYHQNFNQTRERDSEERQKLYCHKQLEEDLFVETNSNSSSFVPTFRKTNQSSQPRKKNREMKINPIDLTTKSRDIRNFLDISKENSGWK